MRRKGVIATVAIGSVLALIGPGQAAECEGDDCQVPPPPPAEVVPGTAVVEGPANPAVRFPKAHKHRKHHRHPHANRGR